jgi:uncharacterized membrane protein
MAMDGLLYPLTLVTALGCALIAGVFFAFSSFVMKALARLPPAHGVAAMQAINVGAISFAFMLALLGTGLGCLALAGWALAESDASFAPHLLAGSGLYLVGVIAVTIAFNVPRNDALARIEPASAGAQDAWTLYVAEWTRGNHVRTAAALGAAATLTVALGVG